MNNLDERMKALAQSALDKRLSIWQLLAEQQETIEQLGASLAASQAEVERLRDRNADLEQYIKKAIGDISDAIDDLSHAKISLQIALKGGAQ